VVVVAALGLAACGRAGPLERPPGPGAPEPVAAAPVSPASSLFPGSSSAAAAPGQPMSEEAIAAAGKTGFDSRGNPIAASGPKRPFILDPLLQ